VKTRVAALVDALSRQGYDLVLTQGVRSVAQQQALYAQGRTKPGKIVTACDGTRHPSNHQPKADGYGYAVDVAWRVAGSITWEGPWPTLGILAAAHGLTWGGTWTRFPDRPHIEWTP
jgi:peptidoglycan L-alanyl-D-glutamate endopeptidase CwlK